MTGPRGRWPPTRWLGGPREPATPGVSVPPPHVAESGMFSPRLQAPSGGQRGGAHVPADAVRDSDPGAGVLPARTTPSGAILIVVIITSLPLFSQIHRYVNVE